MDQTQNVSIIVPVYNVGLYIRKCLDTILEQTYQNFEVILVDDGSTDDSGKIADEYATKDSRFKVIHKENGGVSSARNAGMDVATGDYICFVDSDDLLEKDYVEYLLNLCINNDGEIALTTYMFTTFYDTPQTVNDMPKVVNGEDAATMILYYHIPIGCYCKMFKRDFMDSNHIRFRPEIYIGEGFNFNTASFQRANKVVIGHRKIYRYRRDNTTSAMTKFALHKAEMALHAIDVIREDLVSRSDKLIKACDYAEWHTAGDMYNWMVLANAKNDYPEMYDKCFHLVKAYSWEALWAPVNRKERYRALMCLIHPRFMAWQLEMRRLIFSKK